MAGFWAATRWRHPKECYLKRCQTIASCQEPQQRVATNLTVGNEISEMVANNRVGSMQYSLAMYDGDQESLVRVARVATVSRYDTGPAAQVP